MKRDPLLKLRAICLALPEVTEKIAWGAPTFRVRDRMFVMFAEDHQREASPMGDGDGRIAMWCMASNEAQEMLVEANPDRYFVPAYVGKQGWVGMRLDRAVDWKEVAEVAAEAHRMALTKSNAKKKVRR